MERAITNAMMCFELRATALHLRLHRNEGFSLNRSREINNPHKFLLELNGPTSPSFGAATPTIELTSSLEAATSTTSQIQEIGDLLYHKSSQTHSYNQVGVDEALRLCGEKSL